ncbi:hypothetical protein PAPYR_3189 [Paratrimastix pyriformis]|uniref:Uncharacterized protein n=1 Tax=Paratrimastix pyriformis TaxID=342808 RepID=A0ABQ8UN02_9EUKA|nr:hypothetical protein PAPYR_3189 [Paratrimastix pyriformis]
MGVHLVAGHETLRVVLCEHLGWKSNKNRAQSRPLCRQNLPQDEMSNVYRDLQHSMNDLFDSFFATPWDPTTGMNDLRSRMLSLFDEYPYGWETQVGPGFFVVPPFLY